MKHTTVRLNDFNTRDEIHDVIQNIENDYLNCVGGRKQWFSGYNTYLTEGAKKKINDLYMRMERVAPYTVKQHDNLDNNKLSELLSSLGWYGINPDLLNCKTGLQHCTSYDEGEELDGVITQLSKTAYSLTLSGETQTVNIKTLKLELIHWNVVNLSSKVASYR